MSRRENDEGAFRDVTRSAMSRRENDEGAFRDVTRSAMSRRENDEGAFRDVTRSAMSRRENDEGAFREVSRSAERRVGLLGEFLRYCLICGLLFVFAPPIGWGVAFFWGIGLARRSFALVAAPRLRQRWTERALDAARADPERHPVEGGAGHAQETEPRLAELQIEAVVDSALAARADRIARSGVELRRDTDAPGTLRGDPTLLQHALGDLLDRALVELEASHGHPRLGVEVGDNLAGTETWVRIRSQSDARATRDPEERAPDGPPAPARARRIAEAHGGTLEACSSPEIGFELLLTLPKQGPAKAPSSGRGPRAMRSSSQP